MKDLQRHLELDARLKEEQERNDKAYAIKLVERIVFGLVAMILVGVFGALLALIIK